jgi:hypothetical protein
MHSRSNKTELHMTHHTPQASHPSDAATEVKELDRDQFAEALAGDLELAPIERDGFMDRLQRAFALPARDEKRGVA